MRMRRIAALAVFAGALAVTPVVTGLVHLGAHTSGPVTSDQQALARKPMP
jgi:hypothetical protein